MKTLFLLLSLLTLQLSTPIYAQEEAETEEEKMINTSFEKAKTLLGKGRGQEAVAVIKEAIANAKDSSNISATYVALSSLQEHIKDYQGALESCNKCVAYQPKEWFTYNVRGILLNRLGEYEKAKEDFDHAIHFAENDTTVAALLVNRSTTKSSVRNFKGAYEDLRAAYAVDSNSLSVLTNLGAIADEVGSVDEAIYYIKRGIELYPDNAGLVINLGFIYSNNGKYEEAIECFDKNLKKDPKDPYSLNNRGYCYYKLGKHSKALKDINESLIHYPANSYAYRNRALVYIEQEEFDKACADIGKGLELDFTTNYGGELEALADQYCVKN